MLEAAGTDSIGALLVLLDLLKRQTERVAQFFLTLDNIIRRIRTLLPTWRSIGLGAFLPSVVLRASGLLADALLLRGSPREHWPMPGIAMWKIGSETPISFSCIRRRIRQKHE